MQLGLRSDDVGQDARLVGEDGRRGFVAGCFESQEEHPTPPVLAETSPRGAAIDAGPRSVCEVPPFAFFGVAAIGLVVNEIDGLVERLFSAAGLGHPGYDRGIAKVFHAFNRLAGVGDVGKRIGIGDGRVEYGPPHFDQRFAEVVEAVVAAAAVDRVGRAPQIDVVGGVDDVVVEDAKLDDLVGRELNQESGQRFGPIGVALSRINEPPELILVHSVDSH